VLEDDCAGIRGKPYDTSDKSDRQNSNRGEGAMMRTDRLRVVLPLLVLLSFRMWMTDTPAHAAGGDARKGKIVYEKSCVLCHGPQGRGDGPVGKTVNPPAADFTSAASMKKTDAELLATIENGRPPTAMVGWKGQLSEAEIQDVLAYVKSLRQ
jgi:mono/diheme cytochrome c family protein